MYITFVNDAQIFRSIVQRYFPRPRHELAKPLNPAKGALCRVDAIRVYATCIHVHVYAPLPVHPRTHTSRTSVRSSGSFLATAVASYVNCLAPCLGV